MPAAANRDAPPETTRETTAASSGEKPVARGVSPNTTPNPADDATIPSMSTTSRRRAARSRTGSGSPLGATVTVVVVGRGRRRSAEGGLPATVADHVDGVPVQGIAGHVERPPAAAVVGRPPGVAGVERHGLARDRRFEAGVR